MHPYTIVLCDMFYFCAKCVHDVESIREVHTNRSRHTAGNSDRCEAWVSGSHIEGVLSTILLSCIVNDEVGLEPVNTAGLTPIQVDDFCGLVSTNPLLLQSGNVRVSIVAALLRKL